MWSAAERRRVQSLYQTMALLRQLVLANQYQLLEEARSLHDYLAGAG